MRQKKPLPTFEVLFRGPQIYPERIPVRAVYETLNAVQRLAVGREFDEDQEDTPMGLIQVKRGSAIFECVAKNPTVALKHLSSAGKLLENPDAEIDEEFDYILRPVRRLSAIAHTLGCSIIIQQPKVCDGTLAAIEANSYERIAKTLLLSGETMIIGRVERVGGATEMKCALRIPSQPRLLYCTVESRDLSRMLGQHLYEEIVATGLANWIHRSWQLYSFKIRDIYQPQRGSIRQAFRALRDAGGKAWEKIPDPAAYLREVRT